MSCKKKQKEFIVTVTEKTTVERVLSSDRSQVTVCLPFENPDNYLKYADGPEDFLLIGNGLTFLIYK